MNLASKKRLCQEFRRFSLALILMFLLARPLAAQNDFPLPLTSGLESETSSASAEYQQSRIEEPQRKPQRTLTRSNSTRSAFSKQSNDRASSGSSTFQTIGALAIVVSLILIGAKLWKKHAPASARGLSSDAIDILGRKSVEQGLSIYLIRCGNRILVVGSSADGLQTLTEMTDPAEVDYLAGLCQQSTRESREKTPFFSMFNRQFSSAENSVPPEQDPEAESPSTFPHTIGQISIEPSRENDQNLETAYG